MIETQQAKQALGDIEARHRDIINLEKSIQVCRGFSKHRRLMKPVGYFAHRGPLLFFLKEEAAGLNSVVNKKYIIKSE